MAKSKVRKGRVHDIAPPIASRRLEDGDAALDRAGRARKPLPPATATDRLPSKLAFVQFLVLGVALNVVDFALDWTMVREALRLTLNPPTGGAFQGMFSSMYITVSVALFSTVVGSAFTLYEFSIWITGFRNGRRGDYYGLTGWHGGLVGMVLHTQSVVNSPKVNRYQIFKSLDILFEDMLQFAVTWFIIADGGVSTFAAVKMASSSISLSLAFANAIGRIIWAPLCCCCNRAFATQIWYRFFVMVIALGTLWCLVALVGYIWSMGSYFVVTTTIIDAMAYQHTCHDLESSGWQSMPISTAAGTLSTAALTAYAWSVANTTPTLSPFVQCPHSITTRERHDAFNFTSRPNFTTGYSWLTIPSAKPNYANATNFYTTSWDGAREDLTVGACYPSNPGLCKPTSGQEWLQFAISDYRNILITASNFLMPGMIWRNCSIPATQNVTCPVDRAGFRDTVPRTEFVLRGKNIQVDIFTDIMFIFLTREDWSLST